MTDAVTKVQPTTVAPRLGRALDVTVVAALVLGAVLRIVVGADAPLWIDETETGVFASQPDVAALLATLQQEAGAPLYFVLMRAWSLVAGVSDAALRFPSLVLGLAAPLIALVPNPLVRREARLLWCALIALWIPGLWYAQEARCYTLLLCLAIGTTVTYARLLAAPTLGRAAVWCSLGALAILTHYYAALLVGFQGLAYLAIHRGRAVRTWPAALALLPVAGWMWHHWDTLRRFSDPRLTWYPLVDAGTARDVAQFLFGSLGMALELALLGAVVLLVSRASPRPESGAGGPASRDAVVVVGAAIAAVAVMLALGTVRPTFTERYMTSCVPGILLGVALMADALNRRWRAAGLVFVILLSWAAFDWARAGGPPHHKRYLSFEAASQDLMAAGVTRLAFLWDNPVFSAIGADLGGEIGGFFVRRAGRALTVEAVHLAPGDDPNTRLVAAATGPQSGLLWVYDLNVAGTAAVNYPPRIAALDPSLTCRDYGRPPYGVLMCWRR